MRGGGRGVLDGVAVIDYIACCRISDPDPACAFTVRDFTIGWCPMCEEAIRISPNSMLIIYDTGAVAVCIQCAVTIPGLEFRR